MSKNITYIRFFALNLQFYFIIIMTISQEGYKKLKLFFYIKKDILYD